MSIGEALRHFGAEIIVEGPGRKKSYTQWIAALETSGQEIDRRAAAAKDPIKGQKLLRHISGLERWGQSRLRVFVGAPFVRDEYDGYQPGTTLSLDEQRAFFRTTRQETIMLAQTLAAAKMADTATVVHNDLGPLTVRGWLRYLEMHARFEMKKLR
jgi:hypothetical protein